MQLRSCESMNSEDVKEGKIKMFEDYKREIIGRFGKNFYNAKNISMMKCALQDAGVIKKDAPVSMGHILTALREILITIIDERDVYGTYTINDSCSSPPFSCDYITGKDIIHAINIILSEMITVCSEYEKIKQNNKITEFENQVKLELIKKSLENKNDISFDSDEIDNINTQTWLLTDKYQDDYSLADFTDFKQETSCDNSL